MDLISGLPTSVLQEAAAKSKDFEATYGKYRKLSPETSSGHSWVDEMAIIIQNLADAARNLSCQEAICDSILSELQGRARVLLEQC